MNFYQIKSFTSATHRTVGRCFLGALLAVISASTGHAQTISVTGIGGGLGPAGYWNQFEAKLPNHIYLLQFSLNQSASISEINFTGAGLWSSANAGLYPIVVKDSRGTQLNTAYYQEMGPFSAGSHTLTLYIKAADDAPLFHVPTTATVKLSNGDTATATIEYPDSDSDGTINVGDACPTDAQKIATPGICGCGNSDSDSDGDQIPDCVDKCPANPSKGELGACGCEIPETDTNKNQTIDCLELRALAAPTVVVRGTTANVIIPVKGFSGFEVSVVQKSGNKIQKSFKTTNSSKSSATFTLTPGQWSASYKIRSNLKQFKDVQSKARSFRVLAQKKKTKKRK